MKKLYNKLVRDGVPQLIVESGRECKVRTLPDNEFQEALLNKIIEEVEGFRESQAEEELADIYEVMETLIEFLGFERMHIDYLKMKKKDSRGSFVERVFLEEVEE